MTTETKTELGRIVVTDDLIATIAGYAAIENYGIVGMCAKRAGDSFVELFGRDNLKKGVKVKPVGSNTVDVDLFVTLQYGVSLPAVAENVKSNVKYRLEEMVGVDVRGVNIFVESIRVQ